MRGVIATIVAVDKITSTIYYECVYVAVVIQHALRMTMLLSIACPDLEYFSTLSHKRHDFRKQKFIEHKMCVLIFSTSFV